MRYSNFIYPASVARCQHIKVNGTQCGSPALKRRKFCHFHQQWQQTRIPINANRARRRHFAIDLPVLEDANSIQIALMQITRLLLANQIDHKTAALTLYALQTASSNLRRTRFEPHPQEVVFDRSRVAETLLGDEAWFKQEYEEEEGQESEDGEESEENDGSDSESVEDDEPASDAQKPVTIQASALPRPKPLPRPHPVVPATQRATKTSASAHTIRAHRAPARKKPALPTRPRPNGFVALQRRDLAANPLLATQARPQSDSGKVRA